MPAYVWFIAPALLMYAVFFAYPVLWSFGLAAFDWSGIGLIQPFVGLRNFEEILGAPHFMRAAQHNAFIFGTTFVLQNTVGLGLALLLNRRSAWSHVYRTVIFLPVVMSAVATGFIWDSMLSPNIGAINPFLRDIGLGMLTRNWLADPWLALPVVTLVQFWHWMGVPVVLYLAGLQGVPDTLREAARMDGAGAWRVFRHVTFPLLAPAFTIVTVLSFITSFRSFDLIYVLGGPGGAPDGATAVIGTRIYADAFGAGQGMSNSMRLSYGIAEGVLLFIIVTVVSGILNAVLSRRERDFQ